MSVDKIQTFTFPNGFRIIYQKSPSLLPLTYTRTFCDVGSVYETETTRGASHFIEHMIYKGTRLHPDRKKIFIAFDKIGADTNASTEKRYTIYNIDCQDKYVSQCLAIMSDMLLHSTFNKKEFIKERLVVIEENIKDINDTSRAVYDKMDEMIYDGTSYVNPIDTEKYHIKNDLQYDTVIDMYKNFYHPDRMTLSIISNLSFVQIKEMLNSTFFVKNNTVSKPQSIIHKGLISQGKINYSTLKIDGEKALYIAIGFRTCNYYSNDKYILNFLSYLLSGAMSSRLFMVLREDNGLTYSSSVFTDNNEITGQLVFLAETNPYKAIKNGKGKGVLPLLIKILNDLIKNGVTQDEINITKGYLKGMTLIDIENSGDIAEMNGEEMIYRNGREKSIVPYQKLFDTFINKITKTQVNNIIQKYICKSGMNVCIAGEKIPSQRIIETECEKMLA